ncbi:R3H domain-containing protein 2 [Anabarilius grahami]|uniref:R3H domain-containing protein 2 n=1 Tax=Anabarilius grahami TaxID=495550 RepID=A0A3N0XYE2_ANAGA|nr:R3H domain-containing protein 2 [Anabarilius grahami]
MPPSPASRYGYKTGHSGSVGCLPYYNVNNSVSVDAAKCTTALHRGNRESSSRASSSRQSSTDSDMKSLEPRPWSSTDSDSSNRTLRPPVTKASSFSGISILTRGDSLGSKGSQGSARGSRTGLPTVTPDLCAPTQPPQQGRGLLPCPPNCPSAAPQSASQPLLPTPSHTHTISAHNHMMPQPVASLQPSAQAVSYSNPSCPQVILPVSPSQQYNMGDELTAGFGQMSLSRQGSSEAPEPPSLYQPPPAVLSQHPPPQPSYIMPPPPSGYQPAAPHAHPPPPPPPPSQPILQTAPPAQGYMQPPPPPQQQLIRDESVCRASSHSLLSQIQVQYYSTAGQYPNSGQQYRSISHQVSFPAQRSQPLPPPAQPSAPLQPMMTSQQPAYQGMMGVQQPQSASMMSTQRTGMNGQMQSMMVQYPPMPSYQVPVANESQSVVQQQYQQPVMVPVSQSVQGAMPTATPMPVYYSVLTPTQQNSTSPSVGYLQPPTSDQYQMTQSASPCSPQPIQQQYSGVPPPGPSVMVMQLSVPNGPQPTQNASLVQWNPCKYYSVEQRPSKPEHQVYISHVRASVYENAWARVCGTIVHGRECAGRWCTGESVRDISARARVCTSVRTRVCTRECADESAGECERVCGTIVRGRECGTIVHERECAGECVRLQGDSARARVGTRMCGRECAGECERVCGTIVHGRECAGQ